MRIKGANTETVWRACGAENQTLRLELVLSVSARVHCLGPGGVLWDSPALGNKSWGFRRSRFPPPS